MAGQGSARVTLREIDLSQVRNPQQLPQGVPAAVVGTARKGPAFVPRTFANMQQFSEVFGDMLEVSKESNSNLLGPLALNEWMKSAQAGTFLRVLGVGNGEKKNSATGKTTDAGFVVGQKLIQATSGIDKVGDNEFAVTTDSTKASTLGRTQMLGCFMEDTSNSSFLTDSGVQQFTNATLADAISISGDPAANDAFTIFLPKEITPSTVTSDLTLTIKIVAALTGGAVDANLIEIVDSADTADIAARIQTALNDNTAAGTEKTSNGAYKFSNLSVKLSDIFSITNGTSTSQKTVTVLTSLKEGNEVVLEQTVGGTDLLGVASKTLANSKKASPVIRGVLMTPQGVVATLDPNSLLDTAANTLVSTATATDAHIRSAAYDKVFGGTAGTHLTGYNVGVVDLTTQGFKVILNGFTNKQEPAVLNCSFDPDSSTYFSKVLNTDPTKIEERGHFLYANWDIDKNVAIPSKLNLLHNGSEIADNYANMVGFLVKGEGGRNTSASGKPDYEDFSSKFGTAKTPWIVSQFYSASSNTDERPATAALGEAKKLFRLYSLDDGVVSNTKYRLLVSNLSYAGENEFGSFDLALESFDSDPIRGEVVVAWKNANLDPNSRNFIGRLIGDQHTFYDFERDVDSQRLKVEGQYPLKNTHVRIELSDELKQGLIPTDALPSGFQGHSHLFTSSTGNFLEQADLGNDRVFVTDTETLSKAQIAPLDFVTSISRKLTDTVKEADDDLAWGVKLSYRENKDSDHKELVEQVFNKSIESWTKFFPSFGSNPAWITTDSADSNQNSFFSLEKILIPDTSVDATSKDIKNWDGAVYKRDHSFDPSSGNERFVTISKDAVGGNSRYLKFRCLFQGGFDGVNIFDEEKANLSGVASLREGQDETASQKFTGPTIMSYRRAVDVLTDKSATEFQLLALPGQRSPQVTDFAISACEDRFDAMLVMDIAEKDAEGNLIESSSVRPHVRKTIADFKARSLDTSFAAAYFPDVLVRRPSDNAPIVVPPSVGMMGVMSRNDSIADPWFAPAGLNRGRLNAIDSRVQMNRDLLDELYDQDINPIYVPAGRSGEVYAFGQKTLLQDSSALDRINVRRLLIDIRRKVKKVGEQLLFEPNRDSTLARFSALVEPIMANVQQRRGVERYKVQIDATTTTQNDVENNTIRGKIYLQPTKSVEFISLDFVVANNIQ